jgi:hypothetical protein
MTVATSDFVRVSEEASNGATAALFALSGCATGIFGNSASTGGVVAGLVTENGFRGCA